MTWGLFEPYPYFHKLGQLCFQILLLSTAPTSFHLQVPIIVHMLYHFSLCHNMYLDGLWWCCLHWPLFLQHCEASVYSKCCCIDGFPKSAHMSGFIWDSLHCLHSQQHMRFKTLSLMYNCLIGMAQTIDIWLKCIWLLSSHGLFFFWKSLLAIFHLWLLVCALLWLNSAALPVFPLSMELSYTVPVPGITILPPLQLGKCLQTFLFTVPNTDDCWECCWLECCNTIIILHYFEPLTPFLPVFQ